MKKKSILFSFILLIVGCDPIYHTYYIVHNSSQDTIILMSPQQGDTLITYTIFPAMQDTVLTESGVGYSKPIFDEQKDRVKNGVAFYSLPPKKDSAKNWDSFQFVPSGTWNYSERNRCEGKAVLIITSSDLKK